MSMEIQGSSRYDRTGYAQQLKEKQLLEQSQQEGGAQKTEKKQEHAGLSGEKPVRQDAYISSGQSGAKPAGLYRIGQDEQGRRKIFYEKPEKSSEDAQKPQESPDVPKKDGDKKPLEASGENEGKPAEICIGNTDKPDREIRKLKEKEKQLEQQINAAGDDEKKIRELEKKLAQVQSELSRKDNDTYRRQHTTFTS